MRKELTEARLKELLHYEPTTGVFTRRTNIGPRANQRVGAVAGSVNKGYARLKIDGDSYSAHRLAWFYVHKEWPNECVDHRYGDKLDNRISEIRLATKAENTQNQRRAHANNALGWMGVWKNGARWSAKIRLAGRQFHLGTFDTPEQAHAAYVKKKRDIHLGCTL